MVMKLSCVDKGYYHSLKQEYGLHVYTPILNFFQVSDMLKFDKNNSENKTNLKWIFGEIENIKV